ncbi:hypothetical protein CFOL_v3_31991 [Cephalotus follicularis]|uniref:Reverse transcriptase domain-containing protein n=1 Tax=Cephalotus follicularis TaxID=3775 RepID=A0A1Q3D7Y9_CEPFO|nr:hypothetical protein CFOL_v3_31991 [Cephalotus follicularis]
MFANDILLFSQADECSIKLLLEGLNRFLEASGMCLNLNKCTVVFGNTPTSTREQICRALNMQIGTLPLKYLCLPLVSRGLSAADCKCLIMKMADKIQAWTNKCLSFSGRLQHIQATLSGLHNFWIINAVLPKSTLKDCENIMHNYLWAGSGGRKRSKVSWSLVCKPKEEGGLGLRRSTDCNKAAVMKLIWEILTNKQTLWVRWCKAEILKGQSLWQMERKQGLSVTWKFLLNLRNLISANLVYSIGHNSSWSLWNDPWLHNRSLFERLGNRAIYDSGLSREATL